MYALRLYLHVFHGEPAPFVLEHFEEGHAPATEDGRRRALAMPATATVRGRSR